LERKFVDRLELSKAGIELGQQIATVDCTGPIRLEAMLIGYKLGFDC
jgi:hypothetical protein